MNWNNIFRAGLLFLAVTLGAAEKIALVAYGEKAESLSDLFLAEFGDRYEFVDRTQIPALRQEQFLLRFGAERHSRRLRLTGASLFAALQELPTGQVRATLFETRYGLRLKTATLAGEEPGLLNTLLENALTTLRNPEDVRFLSLAAVRNNLHHSLRPQAQNTTEALTTLAAELDVVFLERDYLVELLRERELAGEWTGALFASEILHFELNPGDSPEHFVIVAYLTDVRETVLFRSQVENPRHLPRLFTALEKHWQSTPRRQTGTAAEEAARFFREAKAARMQGNHEAAVRLSFAAFALDNTDVQYLQAIADNAHQRITVTYPYFRAALEYMLDHPKLLDRFDLHNSAMLLCSIIRRRQSGLSPSEQRDFKTFLARHRSSFLNAAFPIPTPCCRLEQEMNRFPKIVPELYASRTEYRAAMLNSWNNLLAALQAGKPQNMSEQRWNQLLQQGIYDLTETLFRLQYILPRRQLPEWTRSTCQALENGCPPVLRPLSRLLATNAMLYSKEYTEEKVLSLYRDYFLLSRELDADRPTQCMYYDPRKLAQYPGLEKAVKELRTQCASSRGQLQPPPAPLPQGNPSQSIPNQLASCKSADGKFFYFLTFDDFDYKVMRRDDSGILSEIATFPRGCQDTAPHFWQMGSDGIHLAVTDSEHLYTGTGGVLTETGKFPFRIRSIAVCDGRVFLAGADDLMSCDMAGQERRTHLSSSQTGKGLPQQNRRPNRKISALKPGKPGTLYILLSDGKSQEFLRLETRSGRLSEMPAAQPRPQYESAP